MRQKPNYRKIVSGVDLPVPFTIRFFSLSALLQRCNMAVLRPPIATFRGNYSFFTNSLCPFILDNQVYGTNTITKMQHNSIQSPIVAVKIFQSFTNLTKRPHFCHKDSSFAHKPDTLLSK